MKCELLTLTTFSELTGSINARLIVTIKERLLRIVKEGSLLRSPLNTPVGTLIGYGRLGFLVLFVLIGHISSVSASVPSVTRGVPQAQAPSVGRTYDNFCTKHPDVTFRIGEAGPWLKCSDLSLYSQLTAAGHTEQAARLLTKENE